MLDARELADLELIAVGAASPLEGFLAQADYTSVLEHLRLADGTVWPLPFTLAVSDESRAALAGQKAAALFDDRGRLWGVIDIAEVYERDPLVESRAVYGTEDPSHPGVAYLLARPRTLVGGKVQVFLVARGPSLRRAPLHSARAAAEDRRPAAGRESPASRPGIPSIARTSTSRSWRSSSWTAS